MCLRLRLRLRVHVCLCVFDIIMNDVYIVHMYILYMMYRLFIHEVHPGQNVASGLPPNNIHNIDMMHFIMHIIYILIYDYT